jgi:hypothetical protein
MVADASIGRKKSKIQKILSSADVADIDLRINGAESGLRIKISDATRHLLEPRLQD